jgi:predicted membrane-bound mannosyltransferase
LHLLSVFSVFLLFTLKYDKKKTFILCLLFACHPAIVQAVAWIPGRNDSLLALFIILSFYFFIKYTENAKSGYLFGYLFCFVLALLTKETAIVLPFFYFLFLLYKKRNVKQIVVSIIILSLIILIYFFYRKYVLSGQYIATFKEMFTNFYKALLPATPKYIANIFFPIKLSVFPAMLKVNYLLCTASFLSFVLLFIKLKLYDLKIFLLGIFWFFFFLFP